MTNVIIVYSFYFIAYAIIYFIVDFRIRFTMKSLVVSSIIEDGKNEVIGLTLLNTNGIINIYQKDKMFYVLDDKTNKLTIYDTDSKFKHLESDIVKWFQDRITKQKLIENQSDPREKDQKWLYIKVEIYYKKAVHLRLQT